MVTMIITAILAVAALLGLNLRINRRNNQHSNEQYCASVIETLESHLSWTNMVIEEIDRHDLYSRPYTSPYQRDAGTEWEHSKPSLAEIQNNPLLRELFLTMLRNRRAQQYPSHLGYMITNLSWWSFHCSSVLHDHNKSRREQALSVSQILEAIPEMEVPAFFSGRKGCSNMAACGSVVRWMGAFGETAAQVNRGEISMVDCLSFELDRSDERSATNSEYNLGVIGLLYSGTFLGWRGDVGTTRGTLLPFGGLSGKEARQYLKFQGARGCYQELVVKGQKRPEAVIIRGGSEETVAQVVAWAAENNISVIRR